MAALEKQLAPPITSAENGGKDGNRRVGFVSAGVHTQTDGGLKLNTNLEDIELPEESDSEEDDNDKVEIAQKEVPKEVFGGLVRKRDEMENGESLLGALQRLKRLKRESGKPQIAC
ncbi:hypothetical protein LINGRAHAP2_LOCUS11851 [Linum grandiflorum]